MTQKGTIQGRLDVTVPRGFVVCLTHRQNFLLSATATFLPSFIVTPIEDRIGLRQVSTFFTRASQFVSHHYY